VIRTEVRASSDTFDLARLRFADAVKVGQSLRKTNAGAQRQDETAQRVVEYLYETFVDPATGMPGCALVRCFQTHPYADLSAGSQEAARRMMGGGTPSRSLRCLALLGSRGDEAAWNSRETSVNHRAIPLTDIAMVERAPMIARLLSQMGIEARHVVGAKLLLDGPKHDFNVFHIEDARGSEYIPDQQTFVEHFGIRSVVGMGGMLPSGEYFAVILFSHVLITREVAELFRTLALSVKLAFLPFAPSDVFSDSSKRVA
jgi:hypothetical protein